MKVTEYMIKWTALRMKSAYDQYMNATDERTQEYYLAVAMTYEEVIRKLSNIRTKQDEGQRKE